MTLVQNLKKQEAQLNDLRFLYFPFSLPYKEKHPPAWLFFFSNLIVFVE